MKLYLVCRPTLANEQIDSFLSNENVVWERSSATNPEELVELSARVCKMSFGDKQRTKSNNIFLNKLIMKGHESVLEHASWTFIATGLTRAFSHQLVRHRIGFSFSQLSQQYTNQEAFDFIEHPLLKNDKKIRCEWLNALKNTKQAYSKIIKLFEDKKNVDFSTEDKRTVNSIARSILPNCTETKIVFSANARAIRHFLKIRGNIVGDVDMRIFCNELLQIMTKEAPNIFYDFIAEKCEDGYPIIKMAKQVLRGDFS